MEKVKKYPAGTKGRDIVDFTVSQRKDLNRTVYDIVVSNPGYFGQVDIGFEQMQLTVVKNRNEFSGRSLIEGIISMTENLKFDGNVTPSVRVLTDKVTVLNTHEKIVAFVKACVLSSYTVSESFRNAVTEFVKELMPCVDRLCLPIQVSTANVAEKVIVDELNDYLKSLCDEIGYKYTDLITTRTVKESNVSSLLHAAEGK